LSKEAFRILKEIYSLRSVIHDATSFTADQLKRITHIEKIRQRRAQKMKLDIEQLEVINRDLLNVEKDIEKNYTRLDEINANIKNPLYFNVLDKLEVELNSLKQSIQSLEELIFEKEELKDVLNQQIEEGKTFLDGSLVTLQEIKEEIQSEKSLTDQDIVSKEKRISLLQTELPSEFKSKLELASMKHPLSIPFSFIKNNTCDECGLKMNNKTRDDVERRYQPVLCSLCSRIIIPNDIQV
jgi:predicted  nucleic acid-binding Zn-ribbon protein